MLWITKYNALLHSDKRNIAMTIFHGLQGSLVTYFNFFTFLFTLAKFDIYPSDVTNSYISNRHTNLAFLSMDFLVLVTVQ